ncbi:MAG: chromosomal replication initiator protein DnaA [Anaerolineae bacterium]|nr:chromosomal replication initiator protein DnaA [Anaerolineae bacterium]
MEAAQLWQTAQGELQVQMTRAMYDTWLRNTEALSLEDGVLTVSVRNSFVKDWLENRLLDTVERVVASVTGQPLALQFVVDGGEREEAGAGLMAPAEPARSNGAGRERQGRMGSMLNPRYRFENFIVGPSNRMAHAASQAVAEHPATAYNPLFIYGGVGLGKTHLLNAAGHVPQERGYTILYVSSEEFTNDLINSIRNHTTDQFRDKYRSIDVLLIDDIQFIAGKEQTQEEFFHTFNTLHTANKQIILSSDRPPKAIPTLEERLRSRFEWGLTVDIQPPDLETRTAILRAKAEGLSVVVPPAVLDLIAEKVQSNIRELEGALNKVVAQAKLLSTPLSAALAEQVLTEMLGTKVVVDIPDIVDAVCKHYRLPAQAIYGRSRRADIALPRQIVMYLARAETNASLPQIGEALGGRDHTTVIYANDKISGLIESDQDIRRDVMAVRDLLFNKRA